MKPALPKISRVARILEWLAQPQPPTVVHLSLDLEGDEDRERLSSWTRTQVDQEREQIAKAADSMLSNMASDTGQRVEARLIWWTDTGAKWIGLKLLVEPDGVEQQQFDQTPRSHVIQVQRHHEAMATHYFQRDREIDNRLFSVIDKYESVIDKLADLISTRESRANSLEVELAAARDRNAQLELELAQTQAAAESALDTAEQTAAELEVAKKEKTDDKEVVTLITRALNPPPKKEPKAAAE